MSDLKIAGMTVEHMHQPIGLDIVHPRFAWILENKAASDVMQTARRTTTRRATRAGMRRARSMKEVATALGKTDDAACYEDLAYKLLYQNKCPSWIYEVEHGATTMWESWGAVLEDGTVSTYSYNHYAFGCVGEWMYKTIGGLQLIEPGYKKFRVSPDYGCGLSHAHVSEKTPYGAIDISWEKTGRQLYLHV